MTLVGINGRSGNVIGIVDSGADASCLPFDYATLMGYTVETLHEEAFLQVGGSATAYRATEPCSAFVPEIPEVVVEMYPLFVRGAEMILWGRTDFMAEFDVRLMEKAQVFTITPA